MLKIYYGRENLRKDKFIFDSIAAGEVNPAGTLAVAESGAADGSVTGKTLLLVPDQFTLQAERDAFLYLGVKGFMNLDVVSISRLGTKILNETGGGKDPMINKYGRHMLLAKILKENSAELQLYHGMERKQSFIEMMNNFISELKQYGADPQQLRKITTEMGNDTFLKRKLEDVAVVFDKYEEAIAGKYIDTEDYVSLYADKIQESQKIKNAEIWIYGFDAFTPKNFEVIGKLMNHAKNINVVITGSDPGRDADLFSLSRYIMDRFAKMAEDTGVPWEKHEVPDSYLIRDRAPAIRALEQELYALPVQPQKLEGLEVAPPQGGEPPAAGGPGGTGNGRPQAAEQPGGAQQQPGITLIKAANFYSEAETAAAKVLSLVRDQGLKYNEIILICNDLETRGTIVKRVFRQYGMELFLDKKQSILHNPATVFMMSLLELADGKYNSEAIFRLLKTDLTGLPWATIEQLENYARKYKIKGRRWTSDFVKGEEEYGEETFAQLQQARSQIIEPIMAFCKDFRAIGHGGAAEHKTANRGTVTDCVRTLYRYMTEVYNIPEKLEALMLAQEEMGLMSAAAETSQVWGCIMDVLDQFIDVIGDERVAGAGAQGVSQSGVGETLSIDSFADILKAGLEAIELGLLPPTADGLIMGTMQRTRSSHVKAMLVLGANEGLLPAAAESNSLLSEDEKRRLTEMEQVTEITDADGKRRQVKQKIEICKVDDIRRQEEKMAIYKNLSKPSQELWISYSASNENGEALKPSQLISTILEIFPDIEEQKDIISSGRPEELIQASDAGKEHLTAALRAAAAGGGLDPAWLPVIGWYNSRDDISKIREGVAYTGRQQNVSKEFVKLLYRNDKELDALIMSPSRLESYSRCPFAHFVQFGLRPDEQRVFEVGSREIGDSYHNCFMELFRWLSEDGKDISDPDSRWSTVTKEECAVKIGEILDADNASYREGLMVAGEEEKYRSGRIRENCSNISWILIDHVREGRVHSMKLESEFGRSGDLPPVSIETDSGRVLIEGKIDRIDMLDDDRIKIIDYKTGRESFDADEARKGYRLQLMLYLRAAQEQIHKPAGVFYFLIDDPKVNVQKLLPEEIADAVAREIQNSYKMKGTMINDENVIRGIAGDFTSNSSIVSLKRTESGYYDYNSGTLMEEAEFLTLQKEVDAKVKELCTDLLEGKNPAKPMKTEMRSACTFCQFRSICQFDTDFEDCNYEMI